MAAFYHSFMRLGPDRAFLFDPADRFNDFFNLLKVSASPYGVVDCQRAYLPFCYRLGWLASLIPPAAGRWLYLAFAFVFTGAILYAGLPRKDRLSGVFSAFVLTAFSYPFLFTVDRGNFELFVFAVLYMFFAALIKKRDNLAAIFLGIAIALKPFPVVFLGMLLADKKYLRAVWAGVIAALISFLCYASYPGGMLHNAFYHLASLSAYDGVYVMRHAGLGWGNSIYGMLKALIMDLGAPYSHAQDFWQHIYFLFAALSGAALVWLTAVRRFPAWQKAVLYLCAMNLLPYVSGDYKLLNFLIPIILFVNEDAQSPRDSFNAVLFGLLMIPKNYFNTGWFNEGVVINPLLMLLLCFSIISVRTPPEKA